ncbi:hypothetical protein [Kordia sp.]|uniref:hypothetical protein n=1 Tax=Kordia sp. TaxID=1965332 RepID=UPI003B58F27E
MKKITLFLITILINLFAYGQTTTVFIHSLNVSSIPATKESGKSWDNRFENYRPDVYVDMLEKYHNKKIQSYLYTDFNSGKITFKESMIILANDYDTITMTFLDQDSISDDDTIGAFTINHEHLENGTKYYDKDGTFEKRIIIVDSDGFKFEIMYHLKKDIGTTIANYSTKTNPKTDATENNEMDDKKAKALINGNWKSSCGRTFTLVAIGDTMETSVIKQFVGDKEITFKPEELQGVLYFLNKDKTKKFSFKDTQIINYETTDGFKCTWTKE